MQQATALPWKAQALANAGVRVAWRLEALYNFHKAAIVISQTFPIRFVNIRWQTWWEIFFMCWDYDSHCFRPFGTYGVEKWKVSARWRGDADRNIAEDLTSTVVVAEGKQIMHIMKVGCWQHSEMLKLNKKVKIATTVQVCITITLFPSNFTRFINQSTPVIPANEGVSSVFHSSAFPPLRIPPLAHCFSYCVYALPAFGKWAVEWWEHQNKNSGGYCKKKKWEKGKRDKGMTRRKRRTRRGVTTWDRRRLWGIQKESDPE